MNGVTILDTIEIYTLSCWQFALGFTPLIIGAGITFILMSIALKKSPKEEYENPGYPNRIPVTLWYTIVGGVLSLVFLLYLGKACPADYVETRYKVAVDETTSFVEFHDKYNIIEEQSEYLIVTEKSE